MSKIQANFKCNSKPNKQILNRKRTYCKTTTIGSEESQQQPNKKKIKKKPKNKTRTEKQLFEKNVDGEIVDILGSMSKKMHSRLTEDQKKRRRSLKNKINAQNNRNQNNKKLIKLEDTLLEILNKHEQLNKDVTKLEQNKETLQTELEKLKIKVQMKRSKKKPRNKNRKQKENNNKTKNQKEKEINPIFDSLIQQNFFNRTHTKNEPENTNRNEIENEIINQTINQNLH
ncbi:hypothetical protein M0812_01014 [Anaeramoeba flamelloides]|uniref:BZIP domain-containing protein n=1 Tax=Anaeramoeba flamelloides TaxID=1746091 RepID=A0AAV8A7N9_9EUKA|nr:hypothetical protein M0812_01014 [Anaeramoeba flamelloides]